MPVPVALLPPVGCALMDVGYRLWVVAALCLAHASRLLYNYLLRPFGNLTAIAVLGVACLVALDRASHILLEGYGLQMSWVYAVPYATEVVNL